MKRIFKSKEQEIVKKVTTSFARIPCVNGQIKDASSLENVPLTESLQPYRLHFISISISGSVTNVLQAFRKLQTPKN